MWQNKLEKEDYAVHLGRAFPQFTVCSENPIQNYAFMNKTISCLHRNWGQWVKRAVGDFKLQNQSGEAYNWLISNNGVEPQ